MSNHKIAILFKPDPKAMYLDIQARHIEAIQQVMPDVEIIQAKDEETLLANGLDCDILLTWGLYSPVNYCRSADRLKWIHALSAGIDGLAVPDILHKDIAISSTKGIHGQPMAEHVLGMMLTFSRGFHILRQQQTDRQWRKYLAADEICGKTAGIIGLGSIGQEIARKCKLMGMKVLAARRNPEQDELVDQFYAVNDLGGLLSHSDYVIVTVPATPDTFHLIGENEFRAMKPAACFINVARGTVVDEQALVAALQDKRISGAGLDVFETEPLPADSPLWGMPNVIISPHMSAISPYYMDRAITVFCNNLERFKSGSELCYQVDRTRGY